MGRKSYFKRNTVAETNKLGSERRISEDFVSNISSLDGDTRLVIPLDVNLVPFKYFNSRKFLKHGPEVLIERGKSIRNLLIGRDEPVKLREEAFDKIKENVFYCSYSFMPVSGKDQRKRKVSLVECLEGAKMFTYSENGPKIELKAYDDSSRVDREGAEIIVSVPSRVKKASRYQLKFSSVPVKDTRNKWPIAYQVSTDHICPHKRFNIRYRFEDDVDSSRIFNFCSHEIAAYMKIADHYKNEKKTMVPLQMSQFAIPTQGTSDFYTKMDNFCLKEDLNNKGKKKLRLLDRAEKEILLWELVKQNGHDDTFYATEKLRNYDWSVPGRK